MKSKLLLCLALALVGVLSGCASRKFKVMSDRQRLTKSHRIVAEVTCLEAMPKHYTTFRDRYFRILAMPPRVCWSATFQVNQVLKGDFSEHTFTLINAGDAESPYSHFFFEVWKNYLVGFSGTANREVKNFAVLGQEPVFPYKTSDK